MSHFNLIKSLLSLSFRSFFNKYTGHLIPSCCAISVSILSAVADPESHAHLSFMDVTTVPLNMADAMEIFITARRHVDNSVNRQRSRTLSTIESEVPTFAAGIAVANSQCTRPVNMKGSIRKVFAENTVLQKKKYKKLTENLLMKRLDNTLFHVP